MEETEKRKHTNYRLLHQEALARLAVLEIDARVDREKIDSLTSKLELQREIIGLYKFMLERQEKAIAAPNRLFTPTGVGEIPAPTYRTGNSEPSPASSTEDASDEKLPF